MATQDCQFQLQSGESSIREKVVPKEVIRKLEKIANENMKATNDRPIYIGNERRLGDNTMQRYINSGLKYILEASRPWIEDNIGTKCMIINRKSLIRRTWPMSESNSRKLGHNASNLTWHQDSNKIHQESPMLVLVIMMQDKCGSVRPGLSMIEQNTNKFEGVYGYEGYKVDEFEREMKIKYGRVKINTPILNAGDLLIFNGLTFHRTYAHEKMKKSRDAMLIRIIKPEHERNFTEHNNVIINLEKIKKND